MSGPALFLFGDILSVLAALYMLARVTREWINAGDEFLKFWEKTEKFFNKRKKPPNAKKASCTTRSLRPPAPRRPAA